ncbi:MAG: UDP-N-acetylmuramoyl-tripeptide--D-alanyl-D-alanine ligase [Myxococcota bacterium]
MATPIPRNQATFSLAEIAAITGGQLHGNDRSVRGVTTDSRRLHDHELFVALSGERFDGHDYLTQVAEAKACAVVRRGSERPAELACVEVDDTLVALGAIGNAHRRRWTGRIVGITGSAGKTSTKELTAAALRGAGRRVRATEGNLNNRVGVPMTLLTLEDEDEVGVIEMGTSEKGEIRVLAAMTEPDVAVLTLVSAAHTEGLGGVDAVRQEKTDLFRGRREGAPAIAPSDDPTLAGFGARTFGPGEHADVQVLAWRLEGARTNVSLRVGTTTLEVSLQWLGEAAARNTAAALLVVDSLGEDVARAAKALSDVAPVPGRMCPRDASGVLVLDDSYNANPRSMSLALSTARELATSRKGSLVAVLGTMGELGDLSDDAHATLRGEAEKRTDRAIFVGPGFAKTGSVVENAAAAIESLGALAPGDVLLVKGSRTWRLEQVVDHVCGGGR